MLKSSIIVKVIEPVVGTLAVNGEKKELFAKRNILLNRKNNEQIITTITVFFFIF